MMGRYCILNYHLAMFYFLVQNRQHVFFERLCDVAYDDAIQILSKRAKTVPSHGVRCLNTAYGRA